jgi:adenine deaminase
VSHDTHNLQVFGRDPGDMALAANTVIASGGGVAVVKAGEVLASIALPIAGILSDLTVAEVVAAQHAVNAAALSIGEFTPFLPWPIFQTFATSLACLPGPHNTDVGLTDGSTGEIVPSMLLEPVV